jgi:hypothetical protein
MHMKLFKLGDVARECSTDGDVITLKVAEHAALSIPERGRVGTLRYWYEEDLPAFIESFRKTSGRRMKYRTTMAGWRATETADGA